MQASKLVELSEAIKEFVPDGCSVAMGLALETCIPFAAGHEIIRQGKRNLTLIGPISDILFDQLIGAGCACRIRAAWIGNVITGSGYNFRRAVENGQIEVEDHSNLTMAMGLKAAAMGVPFMPTFTALGSDLYKTNRSLTVVVCPFSGKTLTAVRAIVPDTSIISVQRSDRYGNAVAWGNMGMMREACMASRNVIVTCEEIVASNDISRDPNRIIIPGFKVSAVAHVPLGAHPSPMPGFYNRDHQMFLDYHQATRLPLGYEKWREVWINSISGWKEYIAMIGEDRVASLKLRHSIHPIPIDYGY